MPWENGTMGIKQNFIIGKGKSELRMFCAK